MTIAVTTTTTVNSSTTYISVQEDLLQLIQFTVGDELRQDNHLR